MLIVALLLSFATFWHTHAYQVRVLLAVEMQAGSGLCHPSRYRTVLYWHVTLSGNEPLVAGGQIFCSFFIFIEYHL